MGSIMGSMIGQSLLQIVWNKKMTLMNFTDLEDLKFSRN